MITMQLTRNLDISVTYNNIFKIITRIMTDNIIPEHTRFLGISYMFWDIYTNDIYPENIT